MVMGADIAEQDMRHRDGRETPVLPMRHGGLGHPTPPCEFGLRQSQRLPQIPYLYGLHYMRFLPHRMLWASVGSMDDNAPAAAIR